VRGQNLLPSETISSRVDSSHTYRSSNSDSEKAALWRGRSKNDHCSKEMVNLHPSSAATFTRLGRKAMQIVSRVCGEWNDFRFDS
jgi:hypothetical protein